MGFSRDYDRDWIAQDMRRVPDSPVYEFSQKEERQMDAWDAFMEQLPDAIAKELPEEFLAWVAEDPPQPLIDWLAKNGAELADKWLKTAGGKRYARDAMDDAMNDVDPG